ncbi:MAG: DUF309 domain-containing protein [Nitrospiraceae bacterium]
MTEQSLSDIHWPRYSSRPLPPYRFVKGTTPHPRRDPNGHSFGQPEPFTPAFSPEQWRQSEGYLYGVDLYNFAYWWESHEVFEGFWHAVGRRTEQGQFFQGLIQIAAANIKRVLGAHDAAANLTQRGLARLQTIPKHYMGLNVAAFAEDARAYFAGTRNRPALIRLAWPDQAGDYALADGFLSYRCSERMQSMIMQQYPRSPQILLGGMAHLARFIDKIRLRNAGRIQDYNYITTGFDKYLLDLLQIKGEDFERRVLQGGADEELLAWVHANGRSLTPEELHQWNDRILLSSPKDESARQRYQTRLSEVAAKRGVPVSTLPPITTWVDMIELDEERL